MLRWLAGWLQVFSSIQARELVDKAWTRKQTASTEAPAVLEMICSFDQRSFYAASEVLSCDSLKKRVSTHVPTHPLTHPFTYARACMPFCLPPGRQRFTFVPGFLLRLWTLVALNRCNALSIQSRLQGSSFTRTATFSPPLPS